MEETRKAQRAGRFGLAVRAQQGSCITCSAHFANARQDPSEEAKKKEARAARFGIVEAEAPVAKKGGAAPAKRAAEVPAGPVDEAFEAKKAARAARFGAST